MRCEHPHHRSISRRQFATAPTDWTLYIPIHKVRLQGYLQLSLVCRQSWNKATCSRCTAATQQAVNKATIGILHEEMFHNLHERKVGKIILLCLVMVKVIAHLFLCKLRNTSQLVGWRLDTSEGNVRERNCSDSI